MSQHIDIDIETAFVRTEVAGQLTLDVPLPSVPDLAFGMPGPTGPPGGPGPPGEAIISGAGEPTTGDGVDGQFYLDSSAGVLWGPKSASGLGAVESVISPPDLVNPGTYALGSTVKFLVDGDVVGVRFWRTATTTVMTRTMRMYNASQVLVGTTVPSVETAVAGWVDANFPTPIPVTAGLQYVFAVDVAEDFAYANTVVEVNPANADWITGHYGSPGTYPGTANPQNYTVGPLWRPEGEVWPVALVTDSAPVVVLTQAQYTALPVKVPGTVYVVT